VLYKKTDYLIHNSEIHKHNTRRKHDLHVQPCNTWVLKKSVINRGIKSYNRFPIRIKKLEKLRGLK
jgi:hypothetical protein